MPYISCKTIIAASEFFVSRNPSGMLPVLPIYAVSLELAFRSAVSLSVKDRSPRLAEIRAKHFRRFKLVTPVFYWGIGRCFFCLSIWLRKTRRHICAAAFCVMLLSASLFRARLWYARVCRKRRAGAAVPLPPAARPDQKTAHARAGHRPSGGEPPPPGLRGAWRYGHRQPERGSAARR